MPVLHVRVSEQEAQNYKDFAKIEHMNVSEFFRDAARARIEEKRKAPVFGCMRGKGHMAADFDAPLDDFAEYM